MTDNPVPEVDPRYDAAFQRNGAGTTGPSRIRTAAAVRPDPRGGIGLPPAGAASRLVPSREPWTLSEIDGEGSPLPPPFEPEHDEVEPAAPSGRVRGWEIGILVTGVVLVVAGVAGLVWGMDLYYGTMSTAEPSDFSQLRARQVALAIGPAVVGVGVAALVGLLFLRAVGARRAR